MWRALYLVETFQSTLSVRRATRATDRVSAQHVISIHALRKESDGHYITGIPEHHHFNPRSP